MTRGAYLWLTEVPILAAVLTGLFAGLIHVVAGPDHLAAVAPLATHAHGAGARTGARWGVGHAAGVAVVGLLVVLLQAALPLEGLSAWSERIVGGTLIGIGLWGARRAWSSKGRRAEHRHGQAAFGVGVLHGFAGSAHFFGVLPALALPTLAASVGYIVAFGVGTVAAMAGFAGVVAWIATRFVGTTPRAHRAMLATVSGASMAVGAAWIAMG